MPVEGSVGRPGKPKCYQCRVARIRGRGEDAFKRGYLEGTFCSVHCAAQFAMQVIDSELPQDTPSWCQACDEWTRDCDHLNPPIPMAGPPPLSAIQAGRPR